VRTLPLRLTPIEGESLPGYVARYSHTFQFPPGDVLRALGLDGGSGIVLAAGRYGAWLPPDRLERVASATGIDPTRVERMLLSRFAGRAFEQSAGPLDAALAAAAQGHEVLIRCSRFCPHCMRENGAWLLVWQLGWSFVCITHRVLLVRRCPSCDTVPKAALRDRWPSDCGGVLSDPTRCAHRSDRELCRGQLARADTPTVGEATLAAQRRINALLDGESDPTLAGVQLDPPVYLRDCSRSATSCTGTRDRPRTRRHRVYWGTDCMTIRTSSQRCFPRRSRSPISPTPTRSPWRCASLPTSATATTG
jgi:hypothetical protein